MENKMTAVQWFIEQLEEKGVAYENVSFRKIQISIDVSDYLDLKRQAQQIGKEQIKSSWNHGFDWGMMEQLLAEQGEESTLINSEHYYTETYGGNT